MTEHRRPRRRPCLRCDVCLKLRLPLTRPEAVGCVPSKRSIICLLCAPRCSLLCFATFSRGTQRIKIRTLCTGIRIRSSSIRVQLRVAAAAASSGSGRPPWSFSPPPPFPVQWFIFCHNLCRFGCCCWCFWPSNFGIGFFLRCQQQRQQKEAAAPQPGHLFGSGWFACKFIKNLLVASFYYARSVRRHS